MRILVKGGHLVNEGRTQNGYLVIEDGQISEISHLSQLTTMTMSLMRRGVTFYRASLMTTCIFVSQDLQTKLISTQRVVQRLLVA